MSVILHDFNTVGWASGMALCCKKSFSSNT